MGAAWKRRAPVDVRYEFRLSRVAEIMDGEAAIAPSAIAPITCRNHMVQSDAAACRQSRRLASRAIHSWHPPPSHNLGLRDILQVHHAEKVIGETVEMRGHGGIASTCPPQAVNAQARHFEKSDFPHLGRTGN